MAFPEYPPAQEFLQKQLRQRNHIQDIAAYRKKVQEENLERHRRAAFEVWGPIHGRISYEAEEGKRLREELALYQAQISQEESLELWKRLQGFSLGSEALTTEESEQLWLEKKSQAFKERMGSWSSVYNRSQQTSKTSAASLETRKTQREAEAQKVRYAGWAPLYVKQALEGPRRLERERLLEQAKNRRPSSNSNRWWQLQRSFQQKTQNFKARKEASERAFLEAREKQYATFSRLYQPAPQPQAVQPPP